MMERNKLKEKVKMALSFMTSNSSLQSHKTFDTPDVMIDKTFNTSSEANQASERPMANLGLTCEYQAKEDETITIMSAKSYKIYISIGFTKIFS